MRPWPRSSSCPHRAVHGGNCHRSSAQAGRRSIDGSPSGNLRAQRGATDRTESDRSRQARIENSPDHRQERVAAVPGHLACEHARRARSGAARARHPAHPVAPWPGLHPARQRRPRRAPRTPRPLPAARRRPRRSTAPAQRKATARARAGRKSHYRSVRGGGSASGLRPVGPPARRFTSPSVCQSVSPPVLRPRGPTRQQGETGGDRSCSPSSTTSASWTGRNRQVRSLQRLARAACARTAWETIIRS